MNTKQTTPAQGRIAFVDGMRGFAALFVVVYHLSGALKESLEQVLSESILVAFSYGFVGVPIFFVISGLVISTSLNRAIDGRFAGLFIIRRSLRLDPTYWAAILIALCTEAFKSWIFHTPIEVPDWSEIALHLFYLQDLAQVKEPISVVYWTLCLEVQFYLFYMLSKWMSEKVAGFLGFSPVTLLLIWLGIVAIWSVAIDLGFYDTPLPGIFVPYWHYFYAGVLFAGVLKRSKFASFGLIVWSALLFGLMYITEFKAYPMAGLVTILAFGMAHRIRFVAQLFEGKLVLFLGLISYSLYLIHPDIGWKSISVIKALAGSELSGVAALGAFVVAILISIVSAYFLYMVVEKPSLRVVERVKKYGIRGLSFSRDEKLIAEAQRTT